MRKQLLFTLVLFLLGIMLSMQAQVTTASKELLPQHDPSSMTKLIETLTDKKIQLISELYKNTFTLNNLNQSYEQTLQVLQQDLDRLQIITGEIPVKGPGLSITFTNESYLLEEDVTLIINELWAAGAEAIAVNGHRISTMSSIDYIYKSGMTYFILDQQILYPPLTIEAIGNSNTLSTSLTMPGGVALQFEYINIYLNITPMKQIYMDAIAPPPLPPL